MGKPQRAVSCIPVFVLALAVSLPSAAWSAPAPPPVAEAVGLRVTELGLDFVEREVAPNLIVHTVPYMAQPDVFCYDTVGVTNVNIQVALAGLMKTPRPERGDAEARPEGFKGPVYRVDVETESGA